jgi:hypothetical protein
MSVSQSVYLPDDPNQNSPSFVTPSSERKMMCNQL